MKNKLIKIALLALPCASSVFAEGETITIDTSKASSAATAVQTAMTTFINGPLATLVITVAGAALSVWLIGVLFRWARRQGK